MRRIFTTAIALMMSGLILWWPVGKAYAYLPLPASDALLWLSIAGLLLVAVALAMLVRRGWARSWLWLLLGVPVVIRLVHLGLVQFSGEGYTLEFFIHLEPESLALAVHEHDRLLRRGVIMLVALCIPVWLLAFHGPQADVRRGLIGLVIGLAALAAGRSAMPEWALYQAWQEWRRPMLVDMDQHRLQAWRKSGLVETTLVPAHQLRASSPEAPKNLILVYLESVGVALARHPDWPDLMPFVQQLLDEHGWVEHFHASSYITIEGITNSQCGTLFPFARGNDSLATGSGLAEHLVCLGDVLSDAGYHQEFLGGAPRAFAGKAAFLEAHGYDRIFGIDEWRKLGLDQRPGTWGLSDTDLFAQALIRLDELRETTAPWNLTLLTIGTHLPGYVYEECRPYPGSEAVFINALHCTDQLLAEWVGRLRAGGYLDNALLVITADHHVFPNPAMRALFGDTVYDRRLPLIVMGNAVPPAAVAEGAGYDLAATVLDLLNIDHNVRFALGRSLLEQSAVRRAFFRRNDEVVDGQRFADTGADCPPARAAGEVPRVPLDGCVRRELLDLLAALTAVHSLTEPTLDCDAPDGGLEIVVPASTREPLELHVSGVSQADGFSRHGYPVTTGRAGLFVTTFDATGAVNGRHYRRPDDVRETAPVAQPDDADALAALLVWRPTEAADAVVLPVVGTWPADRPGLWLVDAATVIEHIEGSARDPALTYTLSGAVCRALSAAAP